MIVRGDAVSMQKVIRIFCYSIFTILVGFTLLYVLLLSMQAYSQHQASDVLDRLEALRVGDPEVKFENAIKGTPKTGNQFGEALYTVTSGPYRLPSILRLAEKMPTSIWQLSNRLGLRYWRLDITSSSEKGRVRDVWAYSYVVGRHEALGAEWKIAPALPDVYELRSSRPDEQRTYMGWYHITSSPSGEGFSIYATPASTDPELMARHINRKCFLSIRGCDGLCELLPDAIPVLKQRNKGFGGCTSVPHSRCELPQERDCRERLLQQQ